MNQLWNDRIRGSRIGAWASRQSTVLQGREELEARVEEVKGRFRGQEKIPIPPFWGGMRIVPTVVEIWVCCFLFLSPHVNIFPSKENTRCPTSIYLHEVLYYASLLWEIDVLNHSFLHNVSKDDQADSMIGSSILVTLQMIQPGRLRGWAPRGFILLFYRSVTTKALVVTPQRGWKGTIRTSW